MLELGALGGGQDLLFYDQRGGGRSKPTDRHPITWETQARDVGAVIRELAHGMDRPIIVGYSWGGLLALLYAAHATRWSLPSPGALVLVDPAPISRRYRQQFETEFSRRQSSPDIERMRAELAASGLRERDPAAYRQRNFEISVAGYFANPASATDLTPFRVTARVQQSVWDSLGEFDLAADGTLAGVRLPTMVVHGRQDPIPIASSEEAARIMSAEFVPLDDCGHVPYVEQPAALFRAVGSFLKAQSS
jgi:proline iminopeptidase